MYDDQTHMQRCSADGCPAPEVGKEAHNYGESGVCKCGKALPPEEDEDDGGGSATIQVSELHYTLNEGGASYSIDGATSNQSEELVIPSEHDGLPVTGIRSGALASCYGIMSITVPESVTNIGEAALAARELCVIYCEAAQKPDGWVEGWNSLYSDSSVPVVWDCNKNSKDENGYEYAKIDDIRYALKGGQATVVRGFYNRNYSAINVAIPKSVKYGGNSYSVTAIGNGAFELNADIKSITVPSGVTSIGREAFAYCRELTSVSLPDTLKSLGGSAFAHCDALKYTEYNGALYLGNAKNKYVVLVKAKDGNITSCSVNVKTRVIAGSAFSSCGALKNVTISDSVESIGDSAFYRCDAIEKITLGKNIKHVGDDAFYFDYKALSAIEYTGTKAEWLEFVKTAIGRGGMRPADHVTVTCSDGAFDTANGEFWWEGTMGTEPVPDMPSL